MVIIVILLVAAIGGTLAMGVWFISVPLALVLLSLPLLSSLARRISGARRVDEFRARAGDEQVDPPAEGRDTSTLYEPDRQDEPRAAGRAKAP